MVSKKLYGEKRLKVRLKTMKKTSSPTLYKMGSVSSMTSNQKISKSTECSF